MIQGKVACIAKTLTGLEGPLAQELLDMGYENVKPLKRGVQFDSDLEGIYRANLNLRTAMNILMPVKNFKFKDKVDFHKSAMSIPWEDIFDLKKTFSVRSVVFGNSFDNSLYPALLVKDAIADRFRNKFGKRPNVDRGRPDVVVDAYINEYRKKVRRPTQVQLDDVVSIKTEDEANSHAFHDLRDEIFEQTYGDEVTTAMKSLPEEFREVIILCDIEDFSYEEIAKTIELPIGTVRSRLFRARNMLKEKLKQYAFTMGYKDIRGIKRGEYDVEEE